MKILTSGKRGAELPLRDAVAEDNQALRARLELGLELLDQLRHHLIEVRDDLDAGCEYREVSPGGGA